MKEGARGIQSIEVSGRILKALVNAGDPMMLRDLASASELKPAQCHAYLTSLKSVGLVHQDWATGLYSAGPMALRLGVSRLQNDPLTARAIQELKSLTEELGVLSLIIVWSEFGPTIVHIYAGPTQAALNLRHGSLFSVTGTATGRLFAAYCDGPEIRAQIEDELAHRAASPSLGVDLTVEDLKAHVAEIRARGYSITSGNPIPDLNAISVPVFDASGKMAFVASITGRAERLPVEEDSYPVERMKQIAEQVSAPPLAEEA